MLVVDDNVTNRLILRHQLDAWKMLVETATRTAEKALEMLKTATTAGLPYQVALLDVQMPKMDGWTLARAIQANPALDRNAADRLDLIWPSLQPCGTKGRPASKPTWSSQSNNRSCLIA